jgi:L,D-transpeptidase ErfK/SrfK
MPVTVGRTKRVGLLPIAVLTASAVLYGAPIQSILCGTIVGDRWIHLVSDHETWTSIGARIGVDPRVLAVRNGRNTREPLQPGDVLGIDNRHIAPDFGEDGVLVNLPQRMLFHYSQGNVRAHYAIAVGRPDWPTPIGQFSIVTTETKPTWDVPVTIQDEMRRTGKRIVKRVPPGPDNPLGDYWIGLSVDGIGIHGTTAPSSIYSFSTHGCIRLHPEDADDLFRHVDVGASVRVVYQPVLVAFDGSSLYLEVHADPYNRAPSPLLTALNLLDRSGLLARVDVKEVARVVHEAEGLAVPLTLRR